LSKKQTKNETKLEQCDPFSTSYESHLQERRRVDGTVTPSRGQPRPAEQYRSDKSTYHSGQRFLSLHPTSHRKERQCEHQGNWDIHTSNLLHRYLLAV